MMKGLSALAVVLMMSASVEMPVAQSQPNENVATQVSTLKISGMTCAGCEAAVRMAARSVDGVTAVRVSYAKASAEVTYQPAKTTPAAIAKAITEKSGFKAEIVENATKK